MSYISITTQVATAVVGPYIASCRTHNAKRTSDVTAGETAGNKEGEVIQLILLIPLFNFTCGLLRSQDRRRPQATAGDRRRPQETAGDRRRDRRRVGRTAGDASGHQETQGRDHRRTKDTPGETAGETLAQMWETQHSGKT